MEPDTLPEPELDARLAALRVAGSRLDTPRCVEKELMQAFAARFPPRPPWYRRMNLAEWGAAGACATITVAVLASLLAPPAPYAGFASHTPLVRFENGGAFIALDSFERIEQEPAPHIVETELPRAACLLYTSPSPRDRSLSRMPSSA